ncbi:MAG TPA: hypothetical protein ENH00_04695 [Actinobacteria bacterium]|nr:hypothetical protein BMS3Bbin01_01682 [bacterium BMS3Bbin01]HDH25478.1 hypothetical protein [Actinomycetota bacterium]
MAEDKRQLTVQAVHWAIDRAEAAQGRSDQTGFHVAVGEALHWITVLDQALFKSKEWGDAYAAERESDDQGAVILGLRYARNRQVHDTDLTGMQGNPLIAPLDGNELWVWRSLDDPEVPADYLPVDEWGEKGDGGHEKLPVGGR